MLSIGQAKQYGMNMSAEYRTGKALVSFPVRLSTACIASSMTRGNTRTILKVIRAGVGWVWD